MRRSFPLRPLPLAFLIVLSIAVPARENPYSKKHLSELLVLYQGHFISDTVYLKGVDSLAPGLLNDKDLESLLYPYQQIAFGNEALGRYRVKYYRYLAYYSINMNKYGSAVYYSDKFNEEGIRSRQVFAFGGMLDKEGLSHSDLFAISVYFMNRDYSKVLSRYDSLRPLMLKIPAAVATGKASHEQAYLACCILDAVIYSSFKIGDSTHAREGVRLCESIIGKTELHPEKYARDSTFYQWTAHSIYYEQEKYLSHYEKANGFLQLLLRDVALPSFRPYDQGNSRFDSYMEAFNFYFDNGRTDSARHYLDLVRSIPDSMIGLTGLKEKFVLEADSKIQAANGHFEDAYQDLRKLYNMKDSAFYAVASDKDNNLYALAKAENTHHELLRTEAKKRQAELYNTFLFAFIGLLILAGLSGFLVYRARQRQRLMNLQLSLARNFHDEIGPMLMYAGALVKKEGETNPSPRLDELKGQIGNIMESVRAISHDLKTSKLSTVGSLYEDVTALLEKIKASTQIDFSAKINNGSKVLSHLQYTNLRKIVNELITNSIKHAGCTMITFYLKATDSNLRIRYADDGKGMPPGMATEGIGLQNIRERASLLNGEFSLHNEYPKGYSVDISIPLL